VGADGFKQYQRSRDNGGLSGGDEMSDTPRTDAILEQYRVLTDEMLVMMDERNAAVKDAERYRWLRGEFSRPMLEAFFSAYDARNWQDEFTQLDAEIDAAMKEEAK
jgi:hypothetical protein